MRIPYLFDEKQKQKTPVNILMLNKPSLHLGLFAENVK